MKLFIVIKQIYEETYILGAYLSIEGANKKIEEERVECEKDYPGCWELGGWKEAADWTDGGKYKKVRDGYAFKHWYKIEECELEK